MFQCTNIIFGYDFINKKERAMVKMLNSHNPKKWSGLVNVSNKCVSNVLSHMYPGLSQKILQALVVRSLTG